MLIGLPEIGVFGETENKRTDNKNRNNKNQLYNRGDAYLVARCAISHYQHIENES